MNETKKELCENCHYFHKAHANADDGYCKRHAPQMRLVITMDAHRDNWGAWPKAHQEGWCGDYQGT